MAYTEKRKRSFRKSGSHHGSKKKPSLNLFGSSADSIDPSKYGGVITSEGVFSPEDVVSKYSDRQAVEDGTLFDLDQVQKRYFKNSPFSYATANLMAKGYMAEGRVNVPNLVDLIKAASKIYMKMPQGDRFNSGRIELPSGDKQEIYIAQNETGRFTIMLPDDY